MPFQPRDAYAPSAGYAVQRNVVLRNTYWLLALSMIPTLAGAWFGINYQFSFFPHSPILGLLVYFGVAFGLIAGINANSNSSVGVFLLLVFTGFLGLMLSTLLQAVLRTVSNGGELIMLAAGGTATIFGVLATIATVSKRDFGFLSKFLFIGLALAFIGCLANMFFHIPLFSLTLSGVMVLLFSGYILYDVNSVVTGGETNYIRAALKIYLDLFNLFINLLNILVMLMGNRR